VDKKTLRAEMQKIRGSIRQEEKKRLDRSIQRNLLEWDIFKSSASIFCYVSFRSEIDTLPVIRAALSASKSVCVPCVDKKAGIMRAHTIRDIESSLEPGSYGIPEPNAACPEADCSCLDLAIVPGLAFNKRGFRLGYGGGYYDRFLHLHNVKIVCAMTYARCLVEDIPVKKHDVPVDYLILESGVLRTGRDKA